MHSHSYMYIYERPIENISLTLGINSANLCTLALPSDNSHVTSPREGVQPLSLQGGRLMETLQLLTLCFLVLYPWNCLQEPSHPPMQLSKCALFLLKSLKVVSPW